MALVRVDPINMEANPLIRPICLPASSTEDYSGETGIVTGWGKYSREFHYNYLF